MRLTRCLSGCVAKGIRLEAMDEKVSYYCQQNIHSANIIEQMV
jgi:hypothetical protein